MFLRISGETIAPHYSYFGQIYRGSPILCLPYSIASFGQRQIHAIQCVQSFPHTGFPLSIWIFPSGHISAHFSAGDTGVRCVKLLCMNKHRIKDIVDNAAVYFILLRKVTLRELFFRPLSGVRHCLYGFLQGGWFPAPLLCREWRTWLYNSRA